jgi:hypothetical protein
VAVHDSLNVAAYGPGDGQAAAAMASSRLSYAQRSGGERCTALADVQAGFVAMARGVP